MPSPLKLTSRWVLVTGASSGLGLEIARQLARDQRANLVLVARRRDRLEALATELRALHGVEVDVVAADLSREDEVARAFAEALERHPLHGLVLNAGITYFGPHNELGWHEFKQMLDTNVRAIAQLTHLAVPHLLAQREPTGLMFVASMAGLTPLPFQAAYSGTKAFVVSFGHSLWHELRDSSVSVTTFIPGGIATEMLESSGLSHHFGANSPFIQSVEACAREAVEALVGRKHTHVPGALNRAGVLLNKLLPRTLTVGQVAGQYRRALAVKRSAGGK